MSSASRPRRHYQRHPTRKHARIPEILRGSVLARSRSSIRPLAAQSRLAGVLQLRAAIQVIVQSTCDPDIGASTAVELDTCFLRGHRAQVSMTAAIRRHGQSGRWRGGLGYG